MTTFKHTKGVWFVNRDNESAPHTVVFSSKDDLSIAEALGNSNEEAEANAKLIAAAPDLLKACNAVMSCGYGCAPSVGYMDKLIKKCELAIKKATE